jgi:hypothetical protein
LAAIARNCCVIALGLAHLGAQIVDPGLEVAKPGRDRIEHDPAQRLDAFAHGVGVGARGCGHRVDLCRQRIDPLDERLRCGVLARLDCRDALVDGAYALFHARHPAVKARTRRIVAVRHLDLMDGQLFDGRRQFLDTRRNAVASAIGAEGLGQMDELRFEALDLPAFANRIGQKLDHFAQLADLGGHFSRIAERIDAGGDLGFETLDPCAHRRDGAGEPGDIGGVRRYWLALGRPCALARANLVDGIGDVFAPTRRRLDAFIAFGQPVDRKPHRAQCLMMAIDCRRRGLDNRFGPRRRRGRWGCGRGRDRRLCERLVGFHLILDMIEQRDQLIAQALPFRSRAGGRGWGPVVMRLRSRHDHPRSAYCSARTAPFRNMDSPTVTLGKTW